MKQVLMQLVRFGVSLVLVGILVAAFGNAIEVPLGVDGSFFYADGMTPFEDDVFLQLTNTVTNRTLNATVTDVYRSVIRGEFGDLVNITATSGAYRAHRSVVLRGVMRRVDLHLSVDEVVVDYEEPEVSSPEVPFHFFGTIIGRRGLFSRLTDSAGRIPEITFTNLRNGKVGGVKPLRDDAHEYVAVVTGLPGDSVTISIDDTVIADTLTLREDWQQLDINAAQLEVTEGVADVRPSQITLRSWTFLKIMSIPLVVLAFLIYMRRRSKRRLLRNIADHPIEKH